MRPPLCDVCGDSLERVGLVDCVLSEVGLAFLERARASERDGGPGIVGHPPDSGWFCEAHAPRARELAPAHHLAEVIGLLRGADASPAPETKPTREPDQVRDFPWSGTLADFHRTLLDALPALLEHFRIEGADIEKRAGRQWHPMDGAQAPHCPFVEITVSESRVGDVSICVERETAYWNEEDAARSTVRLDVVTAGRRALLVRASSPASGAPDGIGETRLTGELPTALVDALASGAAG